MTNTGNDWMISEVVDLPGVRHALVLSMDGMVKHRSPDLADPDAEKIAAAASGLHSLAAGIGELMGSGEITQQMIEWSGHYLFLRSSGDGSRLAVLTDRNIDPGLIASQMVLQIKRFGEHMATPARGQSTP
ncbi:roadblock/LC7 domain-containing protein [Streptomyces meridianus]|uniref:Roadblock/LC7 domain-containing protein n=1 Tax=Streptomyces meridianus TaxID=2938945 RepID=A0ABT0X5J6_9ACTN|nr:roadblock/LC7 domain-containing protein [Streptomyces meridianus]MCM2577188.1 roadblock/LC7 domain-containing protein [Streptomyces meridianus]